MVAGAQQNKLQVIEALRFFAALAVVFVHIPIVKSGHFGVDAFFIISGFVMMLSTKKSGESFLLKRVIRIVPTYYLFTIGVFGIAFVFPSLLNNTTADWSHLFKSLAFVPFDKNGIGHYPVLFLGWTLNYEMYFYLLFAIALAISHKYRSEITSFLIITVILIARNFDGFVLDVYGDIIVLEFILGMLLYQLIYRGPVSAMIILGVALFVGVLSYPGDYSHRFFIFGVPSLFVILACLKLVPDQYVPRILITCGGASYALYLTHPYIIQVFDKVTGWFDANFLLQGVALVLSLLLVILFSLIVYQKIELPTITILRKRFIK